MKLPGFIPRPQPTVTAKPPVVPGVPEGSALQRAIAASRAAREAEAAAKIEPVPDTEEIPEPARDESLTKRILWYHPESDSHFETIGLFSDDEVVMCDDVTGNPESEARFIEEEALRRIEREQAEEREILEGEIIPPSRELIDVGFDPEPEEISYNVDADHLRRAAAEAARLYNIMEGVTITPDPSQVHAVHTLVHEQYGCLIGAAGTGKTTTTRMLLHTLMNGDIKAGIEPMRIELVDMSQYRKAAPENEEDEVESREEDMARATAARVPSIALCAFTGQATQVLRKNLPPAWRANAMTIHSLLAFAPEEYLKEDGSKSMRFVPTYTEHFKMPWDVIVVDEASMVNLDLWHMMLRAAKPGCRFYFIGDLNQLPPPVGMGILGFALARWTVCELNVVHRQSDEAANKIVDMAWAILKGDYDAVKAAVDDPKENPNWRIMAFELAHPVAEAHQQVINIAYGLSSKRVPASVNPEEPLIYDPFRDRIMTPGNGFNPEDPGHLLGQFPLNESLSKLFTDKTVPRIIIDAQRVTKKFAVGYRIMQTKNEPPDSVNRVTNGQTGRIIGIMENPKWFGDRRLVGEESVVAQNRKIMLAQALGDKVEQAREQTQAVTMEDLDDLAASINVNGKAEKISGPASHIVQIKFDNGAYREYALNADIEQLQIAYASTTHKAQGAEMPTAIIVLHHANKYHLSRENLYTAVTRAKERVILLWTQHGLRTALAKQKVSGRTLAEKIRSYQLLMGGEDGLGFKAINVKLTEADL